MPSLLQTSCHCVFDVSTDFGYLSVSCMWHFWQFICLVTLTGSAAVLEHGDFLPFCRGGAYSDLQIIVLALAILNSTHIARRSLWWPRLILSFSELDTLRYKFNNFLLDFLGSTFTILCGKPGPKSGWCQLPVPKLLVRLLLLIVLLELTSGVRVVDDPWRPLKCHFHNGRQISFEMAQSNMGRGQHFA